LCVARRPNEKPSAGETSCILKRFAERLRPPAKRGYRLQASGSRKTS